MFKRLVNCLRIISRRLAFDPIAVSRIEDKVDALTELVKVTNDITRVPAAHGLQRMAQLANAQLLKRVTDVLDANGIPYWLSFGTLLGAVRHGGSVPWDDDIDIGVLRADHNRLVEILNRAFSSEPNFLAVKSDVIRVLLTDSSSQIDIFAYDEYNVDGEARDRLKRDYWTCHRSIRVDYSRLMDNKGVIVDMADDEIQALQRKLAARYDGAERVLMPGIECGTERPRMCDWSWIFPLRKIRYEGMEFSCPNKPAYVLIDVYGDFMAFPGTIHGHADIKARRTLDAYRRYESLLKGGES